MPYVLNDGKGKRIGIYATCLDITYAQAEILLITEKTKQDHPDAFIVGFPDTQVAMTVERFLEAHKDYPGELEKIEQFRAQIKEKGMAALAVRYFDDGFVDFIKTKPDIQISRSMDNLVNQLTDFKLNGEGDDLGESVEDLFANPLHAGIHKDFEATVPDEMWISDAAKSIRRLTPEKWLQRLIVIMRFYFKGTPRVALPNKTDRCLCGSIKKYGKCCGQGVEHEDPENCKLGKHEFTTWEEVDGKFIRTCEKCYRVYEAPWFEESVYDEVNVIVIGCRACNEKPTDEDYSREMVDAEKWYTCGSCMKPFTLTNVLLEHMWADGKHIGKWKATEIDAEEDSIDLQSLALGKGIFLHKGCFVKALPGWPKAAKPSGSKKQVVEIARDITIES